MTSPERFNSNYDLLALSKFFQWIPYLQLSKPNGFECYVTQMASKINQLRDILNQYPDTLYQPLEDVYILMRCLATIDERLISDLLVFFGWRGAVVSSWFILLNPNPVYVPLLCKIEGKYPVNDWIVKLAIVIIQGQEIVTENHKITEELTIIRQAIQDKLPSPISLTKPQDTLFEHREEICRYYKKYGAKKTVEYMNMLKDA